MQQKTTEACFALNVIYLNVRTYLCFWYWWTQQNEL